MHDIGFVAPSAGGTEDQFSSFLDKLQALSKYMYIFKKRLLICLICNNRDIKVQSNLTLYFNNILKS